MLYIFCIFKYSQILLYTLAKGISTRSHCLPPLPGGSGHSLLLELSNHTLDTSAPCCPQAVVSFRSVELQPTAAQSINLPSMKNINLQTPQ